MSNCMGVGGGPKNLGTLGFRHLWWGIADTLEMPSPACVTVLNLVAIAQAIWA